MITSVELENEIDLHIVSQAALQNFLRRLAQVVIPALEAAGVTFHAVNDGEHFAMDANSGAAGIDFELFQNGGWHWKVRNGLGYQVPEYSPADLPSVTTVTNSELQKIAIDLAAEIAGISKEIVFQNLYKPKAVALTETYNDLQVAMRFVKAWDVMRAVEIIRVDFGFKNLNA